MVLVSCMNVYVVVVCAVCVVYCVACCVCCVVCSCVSCVLRGVLRGVDVSRGVMAVLRHTRCVGGYQRGSHEFQFDSSME